MVGKVYNGLEGIAEDNTSGVRQSDLFIKKTWYCSGREENLLVNVVIMMSLE